MDELTLINHCRQQQRHAQKRLYEKYYPSAFRLSRRYLSNAHDAEDVMIDAFVRIFHHIGEFEYRGNDSLRKWINTIVIHECIRFLSRFKTLIVEEEMSGLVIEKEWQTDASGYDAEEIILIVEGMPDGYRTVFNLFAMEGYSHHEIAGMLSISEGTSKSQLSKARNYIIEKLKKSNGTA